MFSGSWTPNLTVTVNDAAATRSRSVRFSMRVHLSDVMPSNDLRSPVFDWVTHNQIRNANLLCAPWSGCSVSDIVQSGPFEAWTLICSALQLYRWLLAHGYNFRDYECCLTAAMNCVEHCGCSNLSEAIYSVFVRYSFVFLIVCFLLYELLVFFTRVGRKIYFCSITYAFSRQYKL